MIHQEIVDHLQSPANLEIAEHPSVFSRPPGVSMVMGISFLEFEFQSFDSP